MQSNYSIFHNSILIGLIRQHNNEKKPFGFFFLRLCGTMVSGGKRFAKRSLRSLSAGLCRLRHIRYKILFRDRAAGSAAVARVRHGTRDAALVPRAFFVCPRIYSHRTASRAPAGHRGRRSVLYSRQAKRETFFRSWPLSRHHAGHARSACLNRNLSVPYAYDPSRP